MNAEFSLTNIMTRLEDCAVLHVGPVNRRTLEQLETQQFDQAPVLNGRGQAIGVIRTETARHLFDANQPISEDAAEIVRAWVQNETTVRELFEALAINHAFLVGYPGATTGLVTNSDLNRHTFRRIVYALFAELEAVLARLVGAAFKEPREWILLLGEESQVRVFGYWEVSKSKDVDVGPIASTTLTELVRVVSKSAALLQEVGLAKKQFETKTGPLPRWRNRVMHPVRPLVLSAAETNQLAVVLTDSREIADNVRHALTARGIDWRAPWF